MNLRDLKNIMKEVNEPNEYELFAYDLEHPFYWIFKVENVRVKTLYKELEALRKDGARFDVFINGLFIRETDYIIQNKANDFYVKFIKEKFPEVNGQGQPYTIDETDEVKISGDIEKFK